MNARLHEELEAKKMLAELENLDVDSAGFEHKLRRFQAKVLAHAESEEQFEFAQLSLMLDQTRLARMTKAAEIAEAIAPTRPHPGIESKAANMIAGPFVAMVDRARDAITGRTGK